MKLLKRMLIALLVSCSLILVAPVVMPMFSDGYTVEAASVKINSTKKTLYVGEAYELKISGTNKTVKWSSSDKNIATVDSKGRVTAKKSGTATITAQVGSKKYKCKLTVKNYSKSGVKLSIKKLDTSIVVTVNNTNKYAVRVVPKVTFYNEKGKKINEVADFNYCLEPKSKCIMTFDCYDTKSYKSKSYASFKIDMGTIQKSYHTTYAASKIQVKTTKKDNYIQVKAKNKSGKDLSWIYVTFVYYDKKGKLIDTEEHYVHCTKKGSSDEVKFYYPYNLSTHKYIKPAKYEVYVNFAYK